MHAGEYEDTMPYVLLRALFALLEKACVSILKHVIIICDEHFRYQIEFVWRYFEFAKPD